MKRTLLVVLGLVVAFSAFAYLNNAAWLSTPPTTKPILLAHRGLAQTFRRDGLTAETCTATRIHPPVHAHLENTLASMDEAFALGANVVEFDIHPTTDGQFAVFHDWTLDCRTDGHGVTRHRSLAELKRLDIGYGYTADGGQTFPFRGKGLGLMPSLDEVLARFPDKRLLINVKSNDPTEGTALAARLAPLPATQRENLMVYGGDKPIQVLRERLPGMPAMSRQSLTACGLRYILLGWSGYVPAACAHSILLVPITIAPWLWGWPDRLLGRMGSVGTPVFLLGEMDGTDGTNGIDDPADLARLPSGYSGGIWTNRIDLIAAAVGRAR